jgi:hypothetical protein
LDEKVEKELKLGRKKGINDWERNKKELTLAGNFDVEISCIMLPFARILDLRCVCLF